jgi:hypothetical protein
MRSYWESATPLRSLVQRGRRSREEFVPFALVGGEMKRMGHTGKERGRKGALSGFSLVASGSVHRHMLRLLFGSGWAFSEHACVTVEMLVLFNRREDIESEDQ